MKYEIGDITVKMTAKQAKAWNDVDGIGVDPTEMVGAIVHVDGETYDLGRVFADGSPSELYDRMLGAPAIRIH